MPTRLVVYPAGGPLRGSVAVPSDKSIGHRALLLAALCRGVSRISDFVAAEDTASTMACLSALGVRVEAAGRREVRVHGVGLAGLAAPPRELHAGNSGTTMRLLAGVLVAQPFPCVVVGDASLSRRPMGRVAEPLRLRGGVIDGAPREGTSGEISAPLRIGPLPLGQRLRELAYESPVPSAQVKSAVLLSGLYADGPTFFREPTVSRDHTERLLRSLGAPLETTGSVVRLDPRGWNGVLPALDVSVPGDLSAAAFLLVAAQLVPGSRVTVREVGVNPTRAGVLEILRDMGAGLAVEPAGERGGEPLATLHAWPDVLRPARLGGEVVTRAIDELPIVCALAARAPGVTTIVDAAELRVKESDRVASVARCLRAFGVACEERPDGLVVEGREDALDPAEVDSGGDHRVAMTAAVLALSARAPSIVGNADCIATSFPKFVATLRALGARVDVETR